MSSVFSRKITISTFSGCFTGDGTPLKYCTGRRQTYKSSICRKATFNERIPPPTGVVNGPLMPTRYSLKASTVSSGSQLSNLFLEVSPANPPNPPPFARPAVSLTPRRIEHPLAGLPNVRPRAVTTDEWKHRIGWHIQLAVADGNLSARRRRNIFVSHDRQF